MKNPIHILVVEGRFYHHISNQLIAGAEMALREQGATWEVVMVPGALEIPQVLAAAVDAGLFSDAAATPFHGFVALGCVIRGETSHYDIVAGESARALMTLANHLQHSAGERDFDCRERGASCCARVRDRQE